MAFIFLFLCGICVGFMGAFLGIGGGVIIIPLLTLVFHMPIHEAVDTSLAIVVANSVAASSRYLSGAANLRIGLFLALFSVAGAIVGSFTCMNLSGRSLYLILGLAQMLTVLFMVLKKWFFPSAQAVRTVQETVFSARYYDGAEKRELMYTPVKLPAVMTVSGVSGVLSGLVGVGGGVFVVPAMNLIGRMPIKAATSTSGFVMGFTAAGGGILFFLNGYTNAYVTAAMVPGIFIASALATRLFSKVNSDKIYNIFLIFLAFVSIQMLYRGFSGG